MRRQEKKDDAVSPVIGIMLMLVVTIIIAAVITGFATDLSKDTEKTPTAFFDVQYEKKTRTVTDAESGEDKIEEYTMLMLKHKGGEPIRLKDIQLTLEQVGGVNDNGIIFTRYGADGQITVRGDDSQNAVVSTGDVMLLSLPGEVSSGVVHWTLTYAPTNGLVASGEIVIS